MNDTIKVLIINKLNILGDQVKSSVTSKNIFIKTVNIPYDSPNVSTILQQAIENNQATVVLHSHTEIDPIKAENMPTKCYKINRDFTAKIAKTCYLKNIPLIYISNNLVFDGTKKSEYKETDETNPIGVLATSYFQAEQQILEICSKYIILRFSWLIQAVGKNLLTDLLSSTKIKKEVVVVSDQQGSPTLTKDCARVITAIIQQISCDGDTMWGIYHYASNEAVSTNRFAELVITEAKKHRKIAVKTLRSIKTIDNKGLSLPANAKLNCKKILETFGIQRRLWKTELSQLIATYYS